MTCQQHKSAKSQVFGNDLSFIHRLSENVDLRPLEGVTKILNVKPFELRPCLARCPFYTVIQNPRSRSLIQKWWSYKKYFFYALGSSLHHIFWWLNTENIFFPLNDHFWEAWSDPIFMILAISTFSM
jgi:hypothetical protein